MAQKTIRDGDLLGSGIGPEAAHRIQLDALERRAADAAVIAFAAEGQEVPQ